MMLSMGNLLLVIVIVYLVIFVYKTKTGSPYVPSTDKHIKRALKYIKKGDVVYDLGAGDGRVLIEALKGGAGKAKGWEIEPHVWVKGLINIHRAKMQKNIEWHMGDMWRADLSRADVVFVYQLKRYSDRFAKKCRKEMRPGSLVIANTYPINKLGKAKRDGDLLVYRI